MTAIDVGPQTSVNEVILGDAIEHAVEMERLAKGESERHAAAFAAAIALLIDTVLRSRVSRIKSRGIVGRGPFDLAGHADLVRTTRAQVREITAQFRSSIRESLRATSRIEAAFQTSSIEAAIPDAFEIKLKRPSALDTRRAYTSRPIGGRMLSDDLRQLAERTTNRLLTQVNQALARAEATPATIVRSLRTTLPAARTDITQITRTALTGGRSNVRELIYAENERLIEAVQYVATLDLRTCVICAPLGGQLFPVGSGPRPTMHPRCRCTTVPRLVTSDQLAGRRRLDTIPGETRSSMDGPVDADVSFGDWLPRQSPRRQARALGKKASELLRGGVIKVSDYRDADYRPLSLRTVLRRKGLNPSDYGLN